MIKRMSRKKMITILVLFSTLIVLLALLFTPSFIEGMEKNRLKDEITNISERLNKENINLEEIDEYLNKKITSGKRKKVEVSVEKYLKEAVKNSNQILSVTKEKQLVNALNTKTIETNTYDFTKTKEILNQHKENVKPCKEALEKLPKEKAEYIKENNWAEKFIEDCCVVGEMEQQSSNELYKAYQQWCKDTGEYPKRSSDFKAILESLGYSSKKTNKGIIWKGLSLDPKRLIGKTSLNEFL